MSTTTQVGLIGWPIAHSLSPHMHNAAFAALGLDWQYSLFPTEPTDFDQRMRGLSAENIVGGNVTMPHKQTVMRYLDVISQEAQIIGAINTIYMRDGKLHGTNADSIGFVRAMQEIGHDPRGMTVAVLGAGGMARAAVFALAKAGAERIFIVNRTVERAQALRDKLCPIFPNCDLTFHPLSAESLDQLPDDIDMIANTTSVGMKPLEDATPWPDEIPLPANAFFYDVIYKPAETRFLQRAAAEGHATLNGIGMLIHQGTVGFELWTGHIAPLDVMRQACEAALK